MQLLDLQQIRIPAPHRAVRTFQASQRARSPDLLRLQHAHGQALVLRRLRHKILLRPALAPGRVQRQRALPRCRYGREHDRGAVRREAVGKTVSAGTRRVSPGRHPPALTNRGDIMCRNIRTLFNFEPPVTEEEIRAASLQFVRKVSGFNKPSKINEAAFLAAVDEVAAVSRNLLTSLETNAPPRNREEEAATARARTAQRFPT